MRIPDHLPRKLTISLWDFSWYTMTRPGEPYCDLASRFDELVERGYNTIRTCAMPFFLFDEQGRRPGPLRFSSLGRSAGERDGITVRGSRAGRACAFAGAVPTSSSPWLLRDLVLMGISAESGLS